MHIPGILMKLSAQSLEVVSCYPFELKRAHNDILASNAIATRQEELSGSDEKSEKPFDGDDDKKDSDTYSYDYEKLELALADFVVKRKNIQATLSAAIGGERQDHISKRKIEISNFYFGYIERRSIAEVIIRGTDRKHMFHCNKRKCGNECRFKPAVCPHDGCGKMLSSVHLADHDAICEYKPIPCLRGCSSAYSTISIGTSNGSGRQEEDTDATPTLIPRREMDNHINMSCPLRPVECPFSSLGCMAPGLRALDVVYHLEECAVSHSLLMMERISELSQVVKISTLKMRSWRPG